MKFSSILPALLCLLLLSCANKQDTDLALIETIENNLMPTIVIEGEEAGGMNIHARMEHFQVPGVSIAFLNNGKIVWAKGYGYTSADSSSLVDENTLFQAASISKPVAAMAALALVEEGKLDLDADVNLYLEGWQIEENQFTVDKKVTLRRILSHSAGLTVHGFGGYAFDAEVPDLISILNGEEPANSARIYPDTIPGVQYRYSGGGYTIMQKMLCDVTGMQFPELMEASVLSKIGMNSSSYEQPLPEVSWPIAARGHRGNGAMIEGRWHTYPEMAAAGLWTTPTDLLKYAMEVQKSYAGESNLILSQEMTREMLTPQLNNHALGPGIQGSGEQIAFGHGGANEGFRCNLRAFTNYGQGVAIMTNGDRGGELMSEILRSFSKAYAWDDYQSIVKSVVSLKEEELKKLSGQYVLNYQGQDLVLELTVHDKHLGGRQIWNDFLFEIYPESATRFFNKNDGSEFEFLMDAGSHVTGITIYEGSREYFFEKN